MKKNNLPLICIIIISFLFMVSCQLYQGKSSSSIETVTIEKSVGGEEDSLISDKTNPDYIENTNQSGNDINHDFAESDKLLLLENRFTVFDAFPGLKFNRPLDFQNAGDGTGRIFIAEQNGKIYVVNPGSSNTSELFLDISGRVNDDGSEQGLLGLAFHPKFKENGRFFVNYTSGGNTIISRFVIDSNNPLKADPDSEEVIIKFMQPYSNHNGGKLAFGPSDGYLYIGTGDGGGAGDPQKNAQNLGNLLGKILRIDINNKDLGLEYSIPDDNPFKNNDAGYREEIYAYGLRNPWRFSFDVLTGNLWVADVGQNKVEEINIVRSGGNYGWNIMEGSYCYDPPSGCSSEGLELPVYEYEHPLGRSVTGGYVYRGKDIPVLEGIYIYADFITGYIWGLVYSEGLESKNITLVKTGFNFSSFGIDENKEIYLTSFDGKIYRFNLE